MPEALHPLLYRLANRDRSRSEATLQADIRQLLVDGGFGLADHDLEVDLEAQVGDGRRIDVELGFTVIEVKKHLGRLSVVNEAEKQLAGYVKARSDRTGQRYVGILTDGTDWRAYHLAGEQLVEITRHTLAANRPNGLALFFWLEGVLATQHEIRPTPAEISRRLGATSTSHAVDRAALAALYSEHAAMPTVQLKRQLWAQLLRSALGTQFTDEDDLFVEHTLLMNSADIIAHLVVGLDVMDLQPATLLSGQRFERAHIHGVVEPDFFDWPIEVPGGAQFIRSLARRLARFDWSQVQHDVLKVLYESIIGAETRKRMGEYYTPDWLAEQIVETIVTKPLTQRVLDPACGSGTFLFHAVRRHLSSAEQAGMPIHSALVRLSSHVIGVDLHPVAVALARVTYLLAIGRERLTDPKRGPVTIPVYLGDSVQWREQLDLFTEDHLKISAGFGDTMLEDVIRFPERLLADASGFDRLVASLATLAAKPRDKATVPSLAAVFRRLVIANEDRPMIAETFAVMCRLHDEERNHIWSYYIRNLARPVWLAMQENRVDVLVGNPPWLSYRHMPREMQVVFRKLSQDRGLWHGRGVATHQDLSGLFVARAIQQYLKADGSFGFVLPNAVLDRDYFTGFRSGWYQDPVEPTAVAFSGSWDLRRLRPHPFPRGASVVFGRRVTFDRRRKLSPVTERWSGRLPVDSDSWRHVASCVTRQQVDPADEQGRLEASPYAHRFTQGATIVPRMLFFVEAESAGPLGLGAGRRAVRSARSSYEKQPWRDLHRLEGVVETEFVRPVFLGESVLPYRTLSPREAVLPLDSNSLIDGSDTKLDLYPGLADWWLHAERVWLAHRTSERLTLRDRLDFRRGVTAQLPTPPLRLVYGKSGMHVAAAIIDNADAMIDHKLYWGTIGTREEGYYLCAIINSPTLTDLVRPLMSYGKDERDIDKHLWRLPIPVYNNGDPEHRRVADLGARQFDMVAGMEIDESANFVTLRREIRASLATSPAATEIAAMVRRMLSR